MDVNLVLLKKNGSHKTFPLPGSVTVIGRRHSCDLCIPLISVSRKHCQFNRDSGVLKIRDLESSNGTYLNGKRINEAVVKAGDSIKIGPLTFIIQIDGQPQKFAEPELTGGSSVLETDDIAGEQLEDFADLDDLGSLDETGSA
ncbi:MAG: FHA domain-containing protein [Sedimentisphaerales bacterium]|nr:FHA domain-containing protein [Sedimentisphaerales bacterium]